jgi:hypothetical protein
MRAKLALAAALLGAVAGMIAGARWPAAADPPWLYGARTLARVEAAWHAVRQHRP